MKEEKNHNINKKSKSKAKLYISLFLIIFSIFLLLSMISYLFTWKEDQSIIFNFIFKSSIKASNLCGKSGAWLANVLISKGFGLPALLFPIIFFYSGIYLLGIRKFNWFKLTFNIIITIIYLSVLLGFIFKYANGFLQSGPGGAHGYFVGSWLESFIGSVGTILLLIFLFVVLLILIGIDISVIRKLSIEKENKSGSDFIDNINNNVNTNENKISINDHIKKLKIEEDDDLVFEAEFPSREESIEDNHKKSITIEDKEFENNDFITDGENAELYNNENDDNVLEVETIQEKEEITHFTIDEDYDPTLELPNYKLPTLDLLEKYDDENFSVTNEELISNKNKIVETLGHYKIQIDKIKATIGPTVTLYEIVPAPGVRIARIKNLEDDIALNLSALGIRIIAPMPGKGTIGIEVPNQNPQIVSMRSILSSKKFQECDYELPIAIGKTISNETFVFDLAKLPHLLVAGATGQGKSVGLNAIITSLLYKKHPSQLKFVLVDPKKVELTPYTKLEKHYLARIPDCDEVIITDTQKVIYALKSLTIEMDQRYELLKMAQVRNIKEYNAKFIKRKLNPEKGHRFLPYIVLIIDEFADLIMTAGREIETPLARLAQLARAIGIHLIIATQRPTTNIITGVIKANFPARIAFRVSSMVDSRTILDVPGANQLTGRGDMLFSIGSDLIRIQCAFIDIPEIERITNYISSQRGYPTPYYLPEYVDESTGEPGEIDLSKRDSLFNDAARIVVMSQSGSTSLIQRKLSIGYNRAGRIMDQLEAAGIVGPPEGSKPRQVFFPDLNSLEQYLKSLDS